MLSKQLWFTSAGNIEIKEQDIGGPNENDVLVESVYSAISTGTELLIYRGQFPSDIALDTSIDDLKSQAGSFPMRYGYASVGTIVQAGSKVDASVIGINGICIYTSCESFYGTLRSNNIIAG